MDAWMTAINSHIHSKYTKKHLIYTDYWDDQGESGEIGMSIWQVPPPARGMQRKPVGIRSLPIADGPRTGEGVFPGEVVEVVQVLRLNPIALNKAGGGGQTQQTFLRLADDRGWVMENHPTVRSL